ncbi:hypothetical protein V8C42DRAFT_320583 [Trichoderma barbatum]
MSLLSDYYKFLATLSHINPFAIDYPLSKGWPKITKESLTKRNIHRSDKFIRLLHHLPYIHLGSAKQQFTRWR